MLSFETKPCPHIKQNELESTKSKNENYTLHYWDLHLERTTEIYMIMYKNMFYSTLIFKNNAT